ncbi:hypothetical protein CsSME_00008670 [Camellia sinensis var. sinensis]
MVTVTDVATNVGGDLNPGSISLPTLIVTYIINLVALTFVVNHVATPAIRRGLLNHYERLQKFHYKKKHL